LKFNNFSSAVFIKKRVLKLFKNPFSKPMSSDFSNAEIVAYLQSPHYAQLVRRVQQERRQEAALVAKRKHSAALAADARRQRAAENRRAADALESAAATIAASEAAATQQREIERGMLDELRSQLVDAVADAAAQQRNTHIDAADIEQLCLRLQLDEIEELLVLKPKPLIAKILDSIALSKAAALAAAETRQAELDAEVATRSRWSDDELAALSKGMAKFPGGTPNRWDCIRDKFLPNRSTKEVIAKSREIDSLNSAAILKEREQLRSDYEQSQAKKNSSAVTPSVTVAPAPSAPQPPAAAAAAAAAPMMSDWNSAEQTKLEEALRLFPGAATDKARWEQIAAHVGRSRRDVVERVKQCAAAAAAAATATATASNKPSS
jgi:hypothetical protein